MKNALVLVMLACALVYAAFLYGGQLGSGSISGPAKFKSSLHGIDRQLPTHARLTFLYPAHSDEVYASCRYLLAPVYLSILADEHFDTTLTVTLLSDTLVTMPLAGQRLLWQNSDSMYHYYLTCSR